MAILIRRAGSSIAATEIEALSKAERPGILPSDNFHGLDSEGELMNSTDDYMPEETIDRTARQQYEQRVLELSKLIQDARDRGDSEQVIRRTEELEMIEDLLKAETGRGGRPRKVSGPLEKARVRVTNAINYALDKLSKHAPKTAAHLRDNIKTGAFMMYRDASTPWKL